MQFVTRFTGHVLECVSATINILHNVVLIVMHKEVKYAQPNQEAHGVKP